MSSTIDLFLTTNKYLFQKTNSFETCNSDYHHLIAMVLNQLMNDFHQSYEHSWNDPLKNKFKSEAYGWNRRLFYRHFLNDVFKCHLKNDSVFA